MENSHTYGSYEIKAYELPKRGDSIKLRLEARNRQVPNDNPRVLTITTSLSVFIARVGQDSDSAAAALPEPQAIMHGLLDFGLFEKTNEFRLTIATYGRTFEPPIEVDPPLSGDDIERWQRYHILSALARTRRELPREYKHKRLDPAGASIVLDIDRTCFEYLVDRLADEGLIAQAPSAQSIFDGDVHITAKGLQAWDEMSKGQVKPRWQTKVAPEEVRRRVAGIVQAVEDWIPKQRFRDEEAYEAALAEYLERFGIPAPEQQGASLTDVLAVLGIAIEVKLKPDRDDYDRLSGQVIRQLEEFGEVIVLILRPDKRDLLEEFKSKFAGEPRVHFVEK